MKDDNLLDGIENVVDDFLNGNKKQINSDVKKLKNNFSSFMDEMLSMKIHPYQEEICKEWNMKKMKFKCPKCMSTLELFYKPQEVRLLNTLQEIDYIDVEFEFKASDFFCPACGEPGRIAGDLLGIKYKKYRRSCFNE